MLVSPNWAQCNKSPTSDLINTDSFMPGFQPRVASITGSLYWHRANITNTSAMLLVISPSREPL